MMSWFGLVCQLYRFLEGLVAWSWNANNSETLFSKPKLNMYFPPTLPNLLPCHSMHPSLLSPPKVIRKISDLVLLVQNAAPCRAMNKEAIPWMTYCIFGGFFIWKGMQSSLIWIIKKVILAVTPASYSNLFFHRGNISDPLTWKK